MSPLGLPTSFANDSAAQEAAGQLLVNTRGELTQINVELVARMADRLPNTEAVARVIKALPVVSVRMNVNREQLIRTRGLLIGILQSYPKQAESLLSSLLIDATVETVKALPINEQSTVFSHGEAIKELKANGPLAVIAARSATLTPDEIAGHPLSMFNHRHAGQFSHAQIVNALGFLEPGDDATHFLSADEIDDFVAYEARNFEAPNALFSAVIASKATRPETLLNYLQSPLAEFRQDVTANVLSHPNLPAEIANGEWEALFYGKRPSLLTSMNKEQRLASAGHPKLDRHWRRNFVKAHNWDAARYVALDSELLSELDFSVITSRALSADRRDTRIFEALAKAKRLGLRDWQSIVTGSAIAKTWAATTALSTYNSVGMTLPVTEKIEATAIALSSHELSRHEFDDPQVWSDLPGRSAVPMKIPKKVMRDMEMHFEEVFVRVLPSAWDMHKLVPGSESHDWFFDTTRANARDRHYVVGLVSKGSSDFLVTWKTENDKDFEPYMALDPGTAEALDIVPEWLHETVSYVSERWSRPELHQSMGLGGLAI